MGDDNNEFCHMEDYNIVGWERVEISMAAFVRGALLGLQGRKGDRVTGWPKLAQSLLTAAASFFGPFSKFSFSVGHQPRCLGSGEPGPHR